MGGRTPLGLGGVGVDVYWPLYPTIKMKIKKLKKNFFEIFLLNSCIYQNLFVYLHPYLVIIVRMIIILSQIDKRSYIVLVKLAHQSDWEKVEDKVLLG